MSEQPPISIRVRVLDREYPLRVHPADTPYTQHLAQLVDARLRRIRDDIPNQPDLTHAIIGALEMAEELYAARAEIDRLRAEVEVEAKALADRLDAALGAADEPPAGDGMAAEPTPLADEPAEDRAEGDDDADEADG
ncbi:MAG: cell division protein ZapA [Rubricoccaceae bacterium]|nr:cell division protein ZapA [Rubricoccaceae bacterium]